MGRIPRPKGLRAGVEFLGRGQLSQPPAYQLEGLGSAVSSLSGVRGGTPAAKRFSCILEAPGSLPRNLLGAKFGGMAPLALLNPPVARTTGCIVYTQL